MRHLLSAGDLSLAEITSILNTAEEMHTIQSRPIKKLPTLRGRTVINMFFEDSTRTRTSFEMAGKWMSADTINVTGKGSSTSKGESLRDTMLTLDAMGTDCFVIRHGSSGAVAQASGWVKAHVVNAGDGTHEHPTQALLDAFTMRRHFRARAENGQSRARAENGQSRGLGEESFEGKTIAIVGDLLHSRVVRSNVLLQRTLGSKVILVAPPTLLPTGVDQWGCEVTDDFDAALEASDVVMMLRVQRERMHGGFFPTAREYTELYGLTPERLARLRPGAAICHPGPMNRGLEISSEAADAANSLILDQVTAGVSVRMSVLYHLLGGSPE
ncbi:MAG: aspartate carbamoyltransferase catalytic subunit [Micropruina sp.]|uniref:aspartate carbamoyltransferase catalytic subunit n=1 Tax=Micropruina sp. TaxID=2737536 RepID=UPI0039E405EE